MNTESVASTAAPMAHPPKRPDAGPLHVFATPGVDTLPLVAALTQACSASGGGEVRAGDTREAAALAGQAGAGRFIVCVGHPARQVGRAFQSGDDAGALLDQWCTDARHLLRAVQMAPQRFLCLDLEEIDSSPAALQAKLASWLQLDHPPAIVTLGRTSESDVDELARFLACELVRADKSTVSLHDQLLACCVLLAEQPTPATVPSVTAAAIRYRDLLSASVSATREQQQELGAAQQELGAAQQELGATQQENELLLLQLHQVQEELERYYLASKTEEQATGLGLSPLQVERVRHGRAIDQPPHRHLQLRFEGVPTAAGRWATLDAHLVEHHGRPGLALFTDAAGRRPLSAWHTSGRENGREFMLLVPTDPLGARLLQPMGSADWRLVTGLAEHAYRHVMTQATHGPWRTVAARLYRQLADLPARLRYDSLAAAPSQPQPQTLEVRIGESTFGALALGDIVLHWDAERALLHWHAPEDLERMPLSAWPVDAAGEHLRALALPVGSNQSFSIKRAFWSGLSAVDRHVVVGVLDALRSVARQIPGPATHELARRAGAWRREARVLLLLVHWRALARRVLRPAR